MENESALMRRDLLEKAVIDALIEAGGVRRPIEEIAETAVGVMLDRVSLASRLERGSAA